MSVLRHRVFIGDSRNMKPISTASIQVCVTSPPYFRKKTYETQYSTYTDYRSYLKEVWREVNRVMNETGILFVNIGNSFDNQFKSFEVARDVADCGFVLIQPVVWVKGHHSPVQGSKHLNHLYEYIFMFSKGENYALNRLAIGVPYKDKSNIGRWKVATKDLRCRGDVWYINYETVQHHSEKMHDAIFPKELPELCIRLGSSDPADIVLDPFLGSGTTVLAAAEPRRGSVGYEIEPAYEKIIRKKLNEIQGLQVRKA